jgi:hypothetical protein
MGPASRVMLDVRERDPRCREPGAPLAQLTAARLANLSCADARGAATLQGRPHYRSLDAAAFARVAACPPPASWVSQGGSRWVSGGGFNEVLVREWSGRDLSGWGRASPFAAIFAKPTATDLVRRTRPLAHRTQPPPCHLTASLIPMQAWELADAFFAQTGAWKPLVALNSAVLKMNASDATRSLISCVPRPCRRSARARPPRRARRR